MPSTMGMMRRSGRMSTKYDVTEATTTISTENPTVAPRTARRVWGSVASGRT